MTNLNGHMAESLPLTVAEKLGMSSFDTQTPPLEILAERHMPDYPEIIEFLRLFTIKSVLALEVPKERSPEDDALFTIIEAGLNKLEGTRPLIESRAGETKTMKLRAKDMEALKEDLGFRVTGYLQERFPRFKPSFGEMDKHPLN